MITLQLTIIVLLAVNSVALASVEAAFYLLRRRHLGHLAEGNPRAALVNRYLEDPPRLLMPIHLGTYTAHVAMTVVLTSLLLRVLSHWALLAAFGAMMLYLLVFRLSLPYALVRQRPEKALLLLIPAFDLYARALGPLVDLLRRRRPREEEEEGGIPEVPPPPVQEEDEARLARALSRFAETQVREVMTPRPDVEAIEADESVEELKRLFGESKYSRLPVYEDNLDEIVGVVHVRDLLEYDGDPKAVLRPLVRPVFLVPETKRITELLRELQKRGTTLAVVIDEYGGTAGLVSIEDIVEELVGEIKDEFDVEVEPIQVDADGSVLVAGRVALDRLEQALETSLADQDEVGTVGGLVNTVFGRIPRVGDELEYRGYVIQVVEAERRRVTRVRFRRKPVEVEA